MKEIDVYDDPINGFGEIDVYNDDPMNGFGEIYEPHSSYIEALIDACSFGHFELVKLLIQNGKLKGNAFTLTNIDGYSAIHAAIRWSNCDIAIFLIETGGLTISHIMKTTRYQGLNALMIACIENEIDMVIYLFNKFKFKKKHVIAESNFQVTALHLACIKNNYEIVEYLIDNGHLQREDILEKSEEYGSPLDIAITNKNIKLLQLLIEKGNILKDDIDEETIDKASPKIIQILLSLKSVKDYLDDNNYKELFELLNIDCNITEKQLDSDICGICMDILTDKNALHTQCGHYYCINCYITIFYIVKTNNKCSYCKQELSNNIYTLSDK